MRKRQEVCRCVQTGVHVWLIPTLLGQWVLTMCWYQPRTELTLTHSHHHYALHTITVYGSFSIYTVVSTTQEAHGFDNHIHDFLGG